jgi:hypothetical protein
MQNDNSPYHLTYSACSTRELLAMRGYLVHGQRPETKLRLEAVDQLLQQRAQQAAAQDGRSRAGFDTPGRLPRPKRASFGGSRWPT